MIVRDGYIIAVQPSDDNYTEITQKIATMPEAPEGYRYRLKADTIEWELVPDDPTPPEPEDPTPEEALNILLGGEE